MQYRTDLRTGNKLSALGFGCMRFPNAQKTESLILDAVKGGVNYFDTAYLYPGSEDTLGEILAKHGLREKVFIATKLPHYLCRNASDFDKFFDIQRKRLRTGYVDYYLIHNITDFAQWERMKQLGIEKWIAEKKSGGTIKQIGFSFHGPADEFKKLLADYDWDFVQIQYNYINTNYQAGAEGLKMAADKGIPVIIMEPLLGGKLANLPKEAAEILQRAEPGSTPVDWALRFIWDSPGATVILSGMNRQEQLDENIKTAEAALPGSFGEPRHRTVKDIKTVFNKSYKVPCTGCNYCMPCPRKINIPACFEAYNASYAVGRFAGVQQYMTSTGVMSETPHLVSDCIRCGKCEKECPQHIKIPDNLVNVRKRLQIPGLKGTAKIVRKVMGAGK